MGTVEEHVGLLRREKNNFLACSESEHGNVPGMVQHASLVVEHGLKALLAVEDGSGRTSHRGHNLGEMYQRVQTDVSMFEGLVYKLDGMYTAARYDNGFSTGMMRDSDRMANEITHFIQTVESIVASKSGR